MKIFEWFRDSHLKSKTEKYNFITNSISPAEIQIGNTTAFSNNTLSASRVLI